uniref:Uncharacterized protein n=1 Tax=Rhizophora mucronata TaxID=61149 RepID=A0A2P2KZH1_RHIMU
MFNSDVCCRFHLTFIFLTSMKMNKIRMNEWTSRPRTSRSSVTMSIMMVTMIMIITWTLHKDNQTNFIFWFDLRTRHKT